MEGTVGAEAIREIQRQKSESKSETGSIGRRTSSSSILDSTAKERKPSVNANANANGVIKGDKDKLIEIEKAETGSVSICILYFLFLTEAEMSQSISAGK